MSVNESPKPLVGVIMGSRTDLPVVEKCLEVLARLQVPHEKRIVSAHRTPDLMAEYAGAAAARGLKVIVAAAGGAAHLPGMVAAYTSLPVLGIPVPIGHLGGTDALLSIAQMPKGVPVGTLAVGNHGSANAGWLAARIVGAFDPAIQARLDAHRASENARIRAEVLE